MMITPLGAEGGCHVSVMLVKVLLKACSPVTGPGAGEEEDRWGIRWESTECLLLWSVTTKRGEL